MANAIGSFDYKTIISSYIDAIPHKKWWTVRLQTLLNLTPLFLVPFYLYFYKSYGLILRGCINLLLEQYGEATVVKFYPFHRDNPIDHISREHPLLKELDRLVSSCSSNKACATLILNGKIQVRGYCCTKDYLNNFVKHRSRKKVSIEQEQRIYRYVFCGWLPLRKRCPKISCDNSGRNIKGKIVDCSLDGSGLFISTRLALDDISQPLDIHVKKLKKAVSGKVKHTEALYRRKSAVFGYGIEISEDDRMIVATLPTR